VAAVEQKKVEAKEPEAQPVAAKISTPSPVKEQ
jgi:hypothetical protein